MKIAVLGSSGEIGARLVQYFLKSGKDVVAFSRTKGSRLARWENLEFRSLNLLDIEDSTRKLEDIDVVINLIINKNIDDGEEANVKFNIEIFNNLISICKDLKIKRFIHYSSLVALPAKVTNYELENPYEYAKENDWYSLAKIETEKIAIANKKQLPITIIRPGVVYGPFMHWSTMLFNRMSSMNNYIPKNENCLSYAIHVDDLVRLTNFLIELEESKLPELVYGINPEKVSWAKYYQLHAQQTGVLNNLSLVDLSQIENNNKISQFSNNEQDSIRKTSVKEFGIDVARKIYNNVPSFIMNFRPVKGTILKLKAANYGFINYGKPIGEIETRELWPNNFETQLLATDGKVLDQHVGVDLGFQYKVDIETGVKMAGDWWNNRY